MIGNVKNNTKINSRPEQPNIPWPLKRLIAGLGGSLGFVVGAATTALVYRLLGLWPEKESILRTVRK
jgi:hypothetical protein